MNLSFFRNGLILIAWIGLVGCATGCEEEGYYDQPPAIASSAYSSGPVEFCDDMGCRMVDAPYYYSNGNVIYWDVGFNCWIGPRGYWRGGWHRGFVPGYHGVYRPEHYHSFHGNGGFHGGGFHGGGHAGHGGHR
jgi:hypothetical protein